MSEVIDEVSGTFSNIVHSFGGVLTLSIGIAIFAFAAPYLVQATSIVKSVIPSK